MFNEHFTSQEECYLDDMMGRLLGLITKALDESQEWEDNGCRLPLDLIKKIIPMHVETYCDYYEEQKHD